jgi:hypothetical protein
MPRVFWLEEPGAVEVLETDDGCEATRCVRREFRKSPLAIWSLERPLGESGFKKAGDRWR